MLEHSSLTTMPCPACGEDTDFEQPPCVDGHTEDGGECPEWVCVDCGTALVTGSTARGGRVGAARAA